MNKRKISIICPLYCGNKYVSKIVGMINKCVKISNNSYDFELIFVNDYPLERIYIEDIEKECNIFVINNDINVGIHQSRINGLKIANGDYILFLDQDDEIKENYFISQLEKMKDADAVVCNGIWRKNKKIYENEEMQRKGVLEKYFFSYIISPGQVLMKNNVPITWKENVISVNGCDDAYLWNLMKINKMKFEINQEVLYIHNEVDNTNASCDFLKMYESFEEVCAFLEKEDLNNLKKDELLIVKKNELRRYSSYILLQKSLDIGMQQIEQLLNKINKMKIKNIAIYGYGYFGKKLHCFLRENSIEILYAIDEKKDNYISTETLIYKPNELLPVCDIVIVTPIMEYDTIVSKYKSDSTGIWIAMNDFLEMNF
ncbi:MAG: glycosyltransferase family 2 protein [Lachnospiraceae bacterium]|nr:glycosyltransferase family 2 protein [Lachnospiraceae bacterium]